MTISVGPENSNLFLRAIEAYERANKQKCENCTCEDCQCTTENECENCECMNTNAV